MNYAEIIIESEEELKSIGKKQKIVQLEKRIRFLRLLKSGVRKHKKPPVKWLDGNSDKARRYGSCIEMVDCQQFWRNQSVGDLGNYQAVR